MPQRLFALYGTLKYPKKLIRIVGVGSSNLLRSTKNKSTLKGCSYFLLSEDSKHLHIDTHTGFSKFHKVIQICFKRNFSILRSERSTISMLDFTESTIFPAYRETIKKVSKFSRNSLKRQDIKGMPAKPASLSVKNSIAAISAYSSEFSEYAADTGASSSFFLRLRRIRSRISTPRRLADPPIDT